MSNQLFVDVPEAVANQLRDGLRAKLAEEDVSEILGARLVPYINAVLPEKWSYKSFFAPGARASLRVFADGWLRNVVIATAKKQGVDYVYQVADKIDSTAQEQPTVGELWRTFVAVQPTKRLVYDSVSLSVKLLSLDANVDSLIVLPSVQLEEHRHICADFAARLQQDGHRLPALDEMLQDYSADSYPKWLRVLRSSTPPLDSSWGEFRFNQIVLLYGRRLSEVGVPVQRLEELKLELQHDYELISTKSKTAKAPSVMAHFPNADVALTERKARELLHAAIERASYEELREIRIPFGLVMDIIGSTR